MKQLVKTGTTDYSILVFILDSSSTTGDGLAGVTTAMLNARYLRVETDNDVTIAALTLSALSAITDAHSDGGWIAVDATNAPGWYRLDLPDAVFASGAWVAGVSLLDAGTNDIAQVTIEFQLVAFSVTDGVRLGLTALPNAAAAAANGLLTAGTGANQISTSSGRMLVQPGTGTGQIALSSGQVKVQSGTGAGQILNTSGAVTVGTNNDKTGYSISGTKTTLDALNDLSAAAVNAEVDTALSDINLDQLIKNAVAVNLDTTVHDDSVLGHLMVESLISTYSRSSYSLRILGITSSQIHTATTTTIPEDLTDIKGTGFVKDTHSLVDIQPELAVVDGNVDTLLTRIPDTLSLTNINAEVDTGLVDYDAPTKAELDAGLAALNDLSAAAVNAEVDAAIETYGLDHLVAAAVLGADIVDNSIIAKLVSKELTADWDDFDNASDSLQAIRDQGDASWMTGGDATAANQTTILNRIGTPSSDLAAELATIDTNVDAVLVDTGTTLPATLATIDGKIDTVDGVVDAILIDTGTTLDGKIDTIDTIVDSILADTGTDGVVVSTAQAQAIADEIFKRDVDQSEASAAVHSLASVILSVVSKVEDNGSAIIVYRTDGTTAHLTKTRTTNASLEPIESQAVGS